MTAVLETLFMDHDLRLVAMAAALCALSAFAGITLLVHARRSKGAMRGIWVGVAALSVGSGIWATHFVAMLAHRIGFPVDYDIGLTALSLVIAIGACGVGLGFAAWSRRRSDLFLGGATVGLGISFMHYVGMMAIEMGGVIRWDPYLVSISILLGLSLGGLAVLIGVKPHDPVARWSGTGLLTLAICAMHFTAMGAADFSACYPLDAGLAGGASPENLSLAVGSSSFMILLFSLGGLFIDVRERRRAAAEKRRMRGLVDAAVEGLVVCDDRTITAVNASFLKLIGGPGLDITGRTIGEFIPPTACITLFEKTGAIIETELSGVDGRSIPVEIVRRIIDFDGRPHQALAVRDLSARHEAESHIRFLAHHDPMTGLANRASFNTRIEEEILVAERAGQRFAVLCLDLDRFKEVNDLFGHAAGDALLQKVASVLLEKEDPNRFAARLGGDEFSLILSGLQSAEEARQAARELLQSFAAINEAALDGMLISASIGIAMFPDHARNAADLTAYADTALYCAKEEGRNTFRFFEAEMGARIRDRRKLEHELRRAIAADELSLVYQPQVDISSGEVTGFEALLRWKHKERGFVPPAEFIPIAEDSGLVLQIGDWVVREACLEAARWENPLSIAVNVSPVQLHAPNFAQFIEDTLFESGLDPARLEIEITETALIRNLNRALSALRKVKALGVRIAMDDFGTGYSSLSNLRAFPFDKIKVDQSFIRSVHANEQSAAIVRAVLGLGRGLNLPILAEGVENLDELAFLKDEICDAAQGYWFGRPQAIEAYGDVVSGRVTRLSGEFLPVDEPVQMRA